MGRALFFGHTSDSQSTFRLMQAQSKEHLLLLAILPSWPFALMRIVDLDTHRGSNESTYETDVSERGASTTREKPI